MSLVTRNFPVSMQLVIGCGCVVSILGATVLVGWYTHNNALIQVSELFVPMQYNTALGFLLSGLGVLVVSKGNPGFGMGIAIFVMLTGLLTLTEYITGVGIGIDQIMMDPYITVETSHPGRMAPNTALSFALTGIALLLLCIGPKRWNPNMIGASLGSLVFGLGVVALTVYATSFEAAYGWGALTRMAVHTATGFIFLGLAVTSFAWYQSSTHFARVPAWFPMPIGIGVLTIVLSLWQAFEHQEHAFVANNTPHDHDTYLNEIMLVVGIVLAFSLSLTVFLLNKARDQARNVEQINARLTESEGRFRLALDATSDGVWDWNIKTGKVIFSDKWCQSLGYEPDEVVGNVSFWLEAMHPDDKEETLKAADRHFEGKTRTFVHENRLLKKSGEYRNNLDRGRVVEWDDNGTPLRMIGTDTDITEQKQTEEALRRAQKMEAIGQLTGGIAHDFNNILGIIIGNLGLLKGQVTSDENVLRRVIKIDKAAQRAADLTRQLLGFSRKQEVKAVLSDINHLIQGMDSLITRSITPEVEVDQQFSDGLWLTEVATGDFQDSLLNLILNARDAMPDGGRLTIETSNCMLDTAYCTQNPGVTPGEYVQLSVSDTGTGITAELQESIFDPFVTTKPPGKGTGLGLAMVYGFTRRSKGHIKVYSEPGIGTTFRLYLPRAQGQEQEADITDYEFDELPRGNETILAVDDEPGLLELTQESLQALGYRVLTASDGKQALARLAKDPAISLLFSDVVMPGGMNGYELAEQAIADRPDLKILMTSGYTEKAVAHNGQLRFDANLLSKPYTQSELALRVRLLLGESNATGPGTDDAVQLPIRIEWTDALSIGLDPIDDDHRKLIGLLNRSLQLEQDESDQGKLESILVALLEYTRYHFPREEAIMKACNYPGAANHAQVHQLLIKQVENRQQHVQQGSSTLREVVSFLTDWWVAHFQGMDRVFGTYCEDNTELVAKTLAQLDSDPGQKS